jgi:hypothetical protein
VEKRVGVEGGNTAGGLSVGRARGDWKGGQYRIRVFGNESAYRWAGRSFYIGLILSLCFFFQGEPIGRRSEGKSSDIAEQPITQKDLARKGGTDL